MRKIANTAANVKTPILPSAAVNPFLPLDENGFNPRWLLLLLSIIFETIFKFGL